ncbi:MAG TPA: hypothetical protein VGY55_17960 [Pirellulales bacterium]|jgi:hypothetical protein|nr:hypothetical protein [Pirellulales bacterium]
MPFEPRLFRDDDGPRRRPADATGLESSFESAFESTVQKLATNEDVFELPVELAALGEQLSDDADRLPRFYPAGRTESRLPASLGQATGGSGRMIRWGGAAAVLLIGTLSWPMIAERSGDGIQPTGDVRSADVSLASPPVPSNSAVRSNAAAVESKSILGDEAFPAALFRGLTGAEQEAVLDLMQGDPQGQSQLSI